MPSWGSTQGGTWIRKIGTKCQNFQNCWQLTTTCSYFFSKSFILCKTLVFLFPTFLNLDIQIRCPHNRLSNLKSALDQPLIDHQKNQHRYPGKACERIGLPKSFLSCILILLKEFCLLSQSIPSHDGLKISHRFF